MGKSNECSHNKYIFFLCRVCKNKKKNTLELSQTILFSAPCNHYILSQFAWQPQGSSPTQLFSLGLVMPPCTDDDDDDDDDDAVFNATRQPSHRDVASLHVKAPTTSENILKHFCSYFSEEIRHDISCKIVF